MEAVDAFALTLPGMGMVLAGLLVALVAGAGALVMISLLVARPVRPCDPVRRDDQADAEALEGFRIPGRCNTDA
jgi:Na+-transporting methylmalonyl-CoA/oxaloacetate decarboxylase gamma subunit